MKVREIPLDQIYITKNVRLEGDGELGDLMASIEQHEMLQPIGVCPRGARYEVVWGHRRLAAAQLRNEQTIACRILEGLSDSDIPLIKLQENIQRKQLTSEEIVAAADELKARRPGLGDNAIDKLLGKQPGYLSLHRSTIKAYTYLAGAGLNKGQLKALSGDELRQMRAQMEAQKKEKGTRERTYHRGDRTPPKAFDVICSKGPNIVIVCASPGVKAKVTAKLRRIRKELLA